MVRFACRLHAFYNFCSFGDEVKFHEAMRSLEEGKRVKRKAWDQNQSSYGEHPLIMHENGNIDFGSGSRRYNFCIQDFEATDWVEANET